MITTDIEGRVESITEREIAQFPEETTTKQEIVLATDTDKKYPTYIHITFWRDAVHDLANIQRGAFVKVRVSIKSKKVQRNDGSLFWKTYLSGVSCKLLYNDNVQQARPAEPVRSSIDDLPGIAQGNHPVGPSPDPKDDDIPF